MGMNRRAHRKSRYGCNECKRRRIKCGEEKPRCTQCARHDVTCVYVSTKATHSSPTASHNDPQFDASPQSAVLTDSSTSASYSAHYTSTIHPDSSFFTLNDLALLHHWTLVTSPSIVRTPKLDHIWQVVFPRIAFHQPSLMHSILSLAALHVAYLNPSNRRSAMLVAAQHHSKSLRGFREGIDRIGPDNGDALFANATLTFFYAFVTFGKLYDDRRDDAKAAVRTSQILGAEWIPLVRGVEAVLHPVYDHVRVGPLSPLLSIGNWEELDPETCYNLDDSHISRIREIWSEGENAEVYDQTLYLLRKCSAWIAQFRIQQDDVNPEWGYNRDWSGPFIWLFLAPETYFGFLQQRQPPALVILACFGALIHGLDRYWWMEGCGKSIVAVVDQCLGPYWSPWTEWPRQIVGLDLSVPSPTAQPINVPMP